MAPFVKLDTGILDSSLWIDLDAREIFITALLMAEPFELKAPTPQLRVRALEQTGFVVPGPGWYGLVRAAGIGIVTRAGLDLERGLCALDRLGNPEADSRSRDHAGRRLVRVDGGFLVLNFIKYRDKDHGAAERMRRLRARRKVADTGGGDVTSVTRNTRNVPPNVTQAEDREAEDREAESSRLRSKSKHSPAQPAEDATAQAPLELDGSTPRAKADPVLGLFQAWCEVMGKAGAVLDKKRRKLLERWLRELARNPVQPGETAERQALNAIMGCRSSDWHMQSEDRHNLSVIFRDRERVEKFVRWATNPPAAGSKAEQRLRGNTAAVGSAIAKLKAREQQA